MKIFVTLLILAAITVAIVEAQAHVRSRPSGGHGKVPRSSVRTASRNPPRNVPCSKHTHRSKAGGTSLHIKTNSQRNNKPKISNSVRTNKGNTNVKPVPKPIAAKPAPTPQIKKEKVKQNIGQPKNNKPANIVKPTVTSQVKKDADKKKVTNVPRNTVNQQKNNNIKTVPNVKIKGNVKSAIKNLSEKLSTSTAQAKNEIGKKPNNGISINVGSNQQVNKKPETVEDKKVQGTINIEIKNKKPALSVVAEKKIVNSKDTSVSLKGDATIQDGVARKVSFGIDATKNGNSASAQLKVVDGKPALDIKLRKEFLNGQGASFALEAGANLQKGKKPEYSLGMEGAKGGHSVSATAKLVDGKPALDTQLRSEFLNGKDGSIALKTGVNLQKGEKPEYFFGMEGTKDGNSINAAAKIVNGKPEFGLGVTIPF